MPCPALPCRRRGGDGGMFRLAFATIAGLSQNGSHETKNHRQGDPSRSAMSFNAARHWLSRDPLPLHASLPTARKRRATDPVTRATQHANFTHSHRGQIPQVDRGVSELALRTREAAPKGGVDERGEERESPHNPAVTARCPPHFPGPPSQHLDDHYTILALSASHGGRVLGTRRAFRNRRTPFDRPIPARRGRRIPVQPVGPNSRASRGLGLPDPGVSLRCGSGKVGGWVAKCRRYRDLGTANLGAGIPTSGNCQDARVELEPGV
jgi:hypothetical protein